MFAFFLSISLFIQIQWTMAIPLWFHPPVPFQFHFPPLQPNSLFIWPLARISLRHPSTPKGQFQFSHPHFPSPLRLLSMWGHKWMKHRARQPVAVNFLPKAQPLYWELIRQSEGREIVPRGEEEVNLNVCWLVLGHFIYLLFGKAN